MAFSFGSSANSSAANAPTFGNTKPNLGPGSSAASGFSFGGAGSAMQGSASTFRSNPNSNGETAPASGLAFGYGNSTGTGGGSFSVAATTTSTQASMVSGFQLNSSSAMLGSTSKTGSGALFGSTTSSTAPSSGFQQTNLLFGTSSTTAPTGSSVPSAVLFGSLGSGTLGQTPAVNPQNGGGLGSGASDATFGAGSQSSFQTRPFAGTSPSLKHSGVEIASTGVASGKSMPDKVDRGSAAAKAASTAASASFSFGMSSASNTDKFASTETGDTAFGIRGSQVGTNASSGTTAHTQSQLSAGPENLGITLPSTNAESGGFSFGKTTVSTPAKVDAEVTIQTKFSVEGRDPLSKSGPPSEIQGKNVEEIVNDWNKELEQRSKAFSKYAGIMLEWDKHILKDRLALLMLQKELSVVNSAQETLDRQLNIIEMHQRQVHEALEGIEKEAERLYEEEKPFMDAAATERDKMYDQAEQLSSQMNQMGSELREAIMYVNSKTGAGHAGEGSPLSAILHVLNNQMNALHWIDRQTNELSQKLERLTNDK